jgi:hypothetical protein
MSGGGVWPHGYADFWIEEEAHEIAEYAVILAVILCN